MTSKAQRNGSFASKKPGSVGYNHKITDRNAFTEFAKKHGGKTQSEMAELWGNISRQTIHPALKNIGFTRKKDLWIQRKKQRKTSRILESYSNVSS